MVSVCSVIMALTRSPIEITPRSLSPASTGRWRTILGDHPHAVLDGVIWSNGDDRAGHNLVNECVAGGSSLQNDLAGVVPLGDDPHKLAIGHHQKSAHVFFRT